MILRGRISVGEGRAAGFTELAWVRREVERGLGFTLYPGTLNLTIGEDSLDQVRDLDRQEGIVLLPDDPASCTARCYPAHLSGGKSAAIIRPDVPGYQTEKLEIIADCHLRELLNLSEGDWLEINVADAFST